ncbi:MAG TPA: potassium transporter TrkG [Lentisphaeria bacterium]|nr:potassium transporter TrkG [Lentisphaeria bacterium]
MTAAVPPPPAGLAQRPTRKSGLNSIRDMLLRDLLLLCLGTCFHVFILYPLAAYGDLFTPEGLIPIPPGHLLIGYLFLILAGHVLPWLRFFHLVRKERVSSAADATPPSMLMSGAIAMIPLPLYLLVFPANPYASILGIAAAMFQARLLMLSAPAGVSRNAFNFRRLRSFDVTREGLLQPATLRHAKLALAGLGVVTLYQAGGLLLPKSLMVITATLLAAGTLLASLVAEIEILRHFKLIISWKARYLPPDHPRIAEADLKTIITAEFWRRLPGSFWATVALTATLLIIIALPSTRHLGLLALFIRQIAATVFLGKGAPRPHGFWDRLFERPGQLLITSFLGLIFCGGIILALPVCSASGESVGIINGMFTATSAVCVTGLSVLDIATAFTATGQAVIIVLVQLGGLGIMTISLFVVTMLSHKLGVRGDAAMREMTGEERNRAAQRLLKIIVLGTFALEAIGAAILASVYCFDLGYPIPASLAHAVFLSVSSFCNAGFSLHSDNLMLFASNPLALFTIAGLITLGGLSFIVIIGVIQRLSSRRRIPLGCHERLVLSMTAILTLSGLVLFLFFDRHVGFRDLSFVDAVCNALFMSASTRTAGFNSINMSSLTAASVLVAIVLMFIGAAPSSTGGGVKVTTIGVLFLLLRSWLVGERDVIYAKRRIPPQIIMQAAAVVTLTLTVIAIAIISLTVIMPGENIMLIIFETVSAMSTVGLSLGLTPRLPEAAKLIIMAIMFLGRIGLLTFLMSLKPRIVSKVQYADTRILIG